MAWYGERVYDTGVTAVGFSKQRGRDRARESEREPGYHHTWTCDMTSSSWTFPFSEQGIV